MNQIKNSGGSALSIKKDISSEESIIELFNFIDKKIGPVNAVVNNAGINGGVIKNEEISFDILLPLFRLNVFSILIIIREAVKRMKNNGGGAIVNISSESARFGGNKLSHYAASKAAVNAATIALAKELAHYDIRINSVSPGVIETDMNKNLSEDRLKYIYNSLPFGRMGKPIEVAELVCWLLSEKASYVSGSIIPVTGAR